jgi:hypothetical protein
LGKPFGTKSNHCYRRKRKKLLSRKVDDFLANNEMKRAERLLRDWGRQLIAWPCHRPLYLSDNPAIALRLIDQATGYGYCSRR